MTPLDVLKAVPLFAEVLAPAEIETLADDLQIREFPKSTVLMRQGEPGNSMFAIVSGAVEVAIHAPGGRRIVASLGPGEIVGEMSLLTGGYRTATVTVAKPLRSVEIRKAALQHIISSNPGLIARFAGIVEQRSAELKTIRSMAAEGGPRQSSVANLMRAFYMS